MEIFHFDIERWMRENFLVSPKHPSAEAQRRWRSAVYPVKNRKRRFQYVADLDKRSEAEEKKKKIKEDLKSARMLSKPQLPLKDVSSIRIC